MSATRSQLDHLHRRGWEWSGREWGRRRCQYDVASGNEDGWLWVSSSNQALLVDAAAKTHWDEIRTREWPPELFG